MPDDRPIWLFYSESNHKNLLKHILCFVSKNVNFLNFCCVFAVFLNFLKQYTKTKHRIVNNIVLDISWSEKQQNLTDAEKICVFSQAQLENSAKWSFTKMIVLGFGLDLKFKMIDHFSENFLYRCIPNQENKSEVNRGRGREDRAFWSWRNTIFHDFP